MPARPTSTSAGTGRRFPLSRASWRGGALALAAGLLAAAAVDAWYRAHVRAEVAARTRQSMAPIAAALSSAVDRRVALLEGLRSFAAAQRTRAELDEGFPVFAGGLLASTSGVRALQFVERGRIVATWPVAGNEAALGYDLFADPRPVIGGDVRRALASPEIVVTGPISLVQGGNGLLVRRRLVARPGFPDLAAIILDVPALVREAGIPDARTGLHFEVRDRSGSWFGGDPEGFVTAGEAMVVQVPDGDWTLFASPAEGWAAAMAPALRLSRTGSVGFVLALTLLGVLVGARQDRLSDRVETRERQLVVVLQAARMGTWEFDLVRDHIEWDAEAAAILGRTPAELDGPVARSFALVHPDDADFVQRVFSDLVESGRSDYELEYRVVLPDGASRWTLTIGKLEFSSDGKPLRMRGILADATARREMEARLRHSERVETFGAMTGGVVHDFNNLLSAMSSFTELALEQLPEASTDPHVASARADLLEALRVAGRAKGLVAQLLAFNRRGGSDPSRLDVGRALQDLLPMFRRLLGDRIALRVESAAALPRVWIDPGQFTQIFLNLVVNARDAIAERGEVGIRAWSLGSDDAREGDEPPGKWVVIEVADSGAGMREEVRARIFEPYFTTKASARGTGLGLAVVVSAVRAAAGHIVVRSAEEKGARFRVYLPPLAPSGAFVAQAGELDPLA